MEKNNSLFQIMCAAVVITGTLYLLNQLSKNSNLGRGYGAGDMNLSVYENNNRRQPIDVEIVEEQPCYFPNDMIQEFDPASYGWGPQQDNRFRIA